MLKSIGAVIGACVLAAGLGSPAVAQDKWPTSSITIIVPFAPGGAVDFAARQLQDVLSKRLNVSIVVENKAGGATVPATETLMRAKPDGSTLGVFASAFIANTVLLPKVPYDPFTDVVPVSRFVKNTSLFLTQPDSKWNTIQDLVKDAKANPGTISYLSTGVGTAQHLAAEYFQMQAGIQLNHIPYQGAGPAMNDLLGGQAPLGSIGIGPAMPHLKAGKLKALGLTTSPRSPALPNVPTVAEQGYPDYAYGEWFGVMAPKGFPKELTARLHAELVEISKMPEYKAKLENLGLEAEATTPEEFLEFMKLEKKRIGEIAAKGNISIK